MSGSPGLLLVHGEEPRLVDGTVAAWRAAVAPDATDVEVLESPARLEPLIASLVDMPLFAETRTVLVRDLPQLTGARRGATGADELARVLAMRSPTTNVCFAVRATVPAGNPILAAVTEHGGRVVHHPALRPNERRQWLETEARRRGLRLPSGGADVLMRCTGGDLDAMSGELDKLAAHGQPLAAEQFENLVAGTEQLQLYNVVDLLASAQPARGAALLGGLIRDGRSTQYLLSILAGQLRDLVFAHALQLRGHRGSAALASAARMPGWRAERVIRQAQAIPAALVMGWLRDLQRIDARLKAGEVDDAAALQQWGLAVAAALDRRRAGSTA